MTYTPHAGFSGTDTLTYQVDDGNGGRATAIITIAVGAGVGPPAGSPDIATPSSTDASPPNDSAAPLQDEGLATGEALATVPQPATPPVERDRTGPAPLPPTAVNGTGPSDASARETSSFVDFQPLASVSRLVRQALPAATVEAVQQFVAAYDEGLLWNDLGNLKQELHADLRLPYFAAGSVASVTSVLTVGYVLWMVRSGWLVTGLLAQMPAWRLIDPMVVLDYLDEESTNSKAGNDRGEDDDSLESMLERQHEDDATSTVDEPAPELLESAI
jgi:hypothetical protein